jgi:hypothetical protein
MTYNAYPSSKYTPHTAPARKQVVKRWDAAFTSLLLLLNTSNPSYSQRLAGLLANFYNSRVTVLHQDPFSAINSIKRCRHYYLDAVRTTRDQAFSAMDVSIRDDAENRPPHKVPFMNDIIDYRETLSKSLGGDQLLLYDRLVMALLTFDRLVSVESEPNYSTITSPRKIVGSTEIALEVGGLRDHLSALGLDSDAFKAEYARRARSLRHVIMSSAGPNGPATWTAHSDAKVILGNVSLMTSFQSICEHGSMKWLLSDMLGCAHLPTYDSRPDHMLTASRLHSIEEWGGKNRLVAIMDYWTQMALSPLHDTIFHFLSKIEADGTFDQDAAVERVRRMSESGGEELHSLDLTAATDRLPVDFQTDVLTELIGPEIAQAWRSLLTDRDYLTPDGKEVRYAVGQPMGARSSWAMLALSHHVIVKAAANFSNRPDFTDYAIVGDDIVIKSHNVAVDYKKILVGLGVDISAPKSIEPIANCKPAAEFCKRIFLEGRELTTFPMKTVSKAVTNGKLSTVLQNELHKRHYGPFDRSVIDWIAALVDEESLDYLLILNKLPTDLTGLRQSIDLGEQSMPLKNWFPGYTLTPEDVTRAYTFVVVTEQLKRLDVLLRQTQAIAAAIEDQAYGYHTVQPSDLGWKFSPEDLTQEALNEKIKSLPAGAYSHPVVKASSSEIERVSDLLVALKTGHADLTKMARGRLLDAFRNALADSMTDRNEGRAQADRSLVQRALMTIADCLTRTDAKKANYHRVDYSATLVFFNRTWTVSWRLGSEVAINHVKSRVITDHVKAKARVDDRLLKLSVSTRFSRSLPISKRN